jgi:hypothetical protein
LKSATDARALTEVSRVHADLNRIGRRAEPRATEKLPRRAADREAHQGVDSFARWALKTLVPALLSTELLSWADMHDACGRFGVVLPLHVNGLVF